MSTVVQTYEQAIEYLYGRINYERVRADRVSAGDFKLDRVRRLLELIGNPQDRLPAVHIAGTKGKGSTAVMIAAMLSAADHRTGLFTSPHLFAFEERMTVDGVSPGREEVVDLVNRLAGPVARMDCTAGRMSPTFFEITTAMAWLYFLQREAELAVLEVGLGGRLDATNVCHPQAAVITSISRDHTALLGGTTAQIAREKAGIVKRGVPIVSGVTDDEPRRVIEAACAEHGSPLFQFGREIRYRPSVSSRVGDVHPSSAAGIAPPSTVIDVETPTRGWPEIPVPLLGEHQSANAALAVAVIDLLCGRGYRVPEQAVRRGLAGMKWPIRIEVVGWRPTVVVDAAHNCASVAALIKTLNTTFHPRRRILVFGTSRDKDVSGMLRQLLPEFDAAILTKYLNNPRAVPVENLRRRVQTLSEFPVHSAPDPPTAWKLARHLATEDDLICVTGSFFLAAEMRELTADAFQQPEPRLTAPTQPPTPR